MFDIGFLELLVVGILALLVLGPERLPGAVKTTSLWISRLRRSFQQMKAEIERELNTEEIRQQIHNESIMKSLEKTKSDIENNLQGARDSLTKELGDDSYDLSDAFHQEGDTLPDHPPLPDPDELQQAPGTAPPDPTDKS